MSEDNPTLISGPEQERRPPADNKAERAHYESRQNRTAALEAAVRCAQPGAHASAVLEDARQFLEWLTADA